MRNWFYVLFLVPYLTIATAGGMYIPSEIGETVGTITNVGDGNLRVVGEPLNAAGLRDIKVDIGTAPIYDLVTGFPVCISNIEPDMNVRIAYETSKMGIAAAVAVWLNCDYEDSAVFTVVVSENIQYGHDFCVFLSADGKYRVTLTPDTEIIDPDYGELLPHDILPGQEFFVWVDMITASSPSIVYPDKVVLIND